MRCSPRRREEHQPLVSEARGRGARGRRGVPAGARMTTGSSAGRGRITPRGRRRCPAGRGRRGGDRHTCVLATAGAVACWGANRYREVAPGETEEEPVARERLAAGAGGRNLRRWHGDLRRPRLRRDRVLGLGDGGSAGAHRRCPERSPSTSGRPRGARSSGRGTSSAGTCGGRPRVPRCPWCGGRERRLVARLRRPRDRGRPALGENYAGELCRRDSYTVDMRLADEAETARWLESLAAPEALEGDRGNRMKSEEKHGLCGG